MERIPVVTMLTDFGLVDGYVGMMKGVILGIAPQARLVDISHGISPRDVRHAAYVLYTAHSFFPPGTVHLVVVDPGVGGTRRAMALRTRLAYFVGPDNGVFSYVMACEPVEVVVELADPRYQLPRVSRTFHGRDLFAPAAAHLAAGVAITELGPPLADPVTLPPPLLEAAGGNITGEVLHIDRFGNVVTSIGRLVWFGDRLSLEPVAWGTGGGRQVDFEADDVTVTVAGREIAGIRGTYADGEPGQVLALVGSSGQLEIAVRDGSAARKLGLQPGDRVVLAYQ